MNSILKKSLIRGIPAGLVLALIVIAARVLISKTGFMETLSSLYGILTLICFPVFFVLVFYTGMKKKS